MSKLDCEIAVIGGGAAGMMAAGRAGESGAHTLLIEKNRQLGRKVMITGKGRCNLTTSVPTTEEIIEEFPGSGKFLFSALNKFSNWDTIEFFEKMGLETKLERGNRVFPASDRAADVAKSLEKYVTANKVEVLRECTVKSIELQKNGIFSLYSTGGVINSLSVIVAAGGASYPQTGSSGDAYLWLERLGHTVIPPKPALVPLQVEEEWVKELQGLTLKNVQVELLKDKETINRLFGEMLFTHFGVSGPVILTLSRSVSSSIGSGAKLELSIDLKPALSEEKLDKRVQRDFDKYARKQLKNGLVDLLPKALIPVIIETSGIDPDRYVHQVTRQERQRLVSVLKGLPLTIKGVRPLSEAIVTAGGAAVSEIDPKTMESKLVSGLFLAGEVLDIDGNTGGYNMQAAFSTGFTAGDSAAEKLKKKQG